MAAPSIPLPGNLPILAWSELQMGQLIGQGGYSEVFRGQLNGKEIAIKQLLLKKLPEHLVKDFENETKIMVQVAKCLQIIRLIGVCMEEGHYAMVMEYMEKGSLFDVLQNADQGYDPAQCNLGWYYETGTGVKKDEAMAVKYYQLAADQGNVDAKAALTRLIPRAGYNS